jgi:hypothetical protein
VLLNVHSAHRFIALTATLRASDVHDLCSRIGLGNDIRILRYSCFCQNITFQLRKFGARLAARESLYAWARQHQQYYTLIICTSIAEATIVASELDCPLTVSNQKLQDDVLIAQFESRKILVGTSRAATGLDLTELNRVAIFGQPFSAEYVIQAAGRIRCEGTAAVFYFMEPPRPVDDICICIQNSKCGAELHHKICSLIDGNIENSNPTISMIPDISDDTKLSLLPGLLSDSAVAVSTRLSRLKGRLKILEATFAASIMSNCCKVCYLLTGQRVLHDITMCHRLFNICWHCFEPHQSRSCPKMPRLGRMCFQCYLPLDPAGGICFHEGSSGKTCNQVRSHFFVT